MKQSSLHDKLTNSEWNIGAGTAYKSEKIWFGAGLSYKEKYNSQEKTGFTVKLIDEEEKIDSQIMAIQTPQEEYNINLNAGYRLSERDILTYDITGKVTGKRPDKIDLSIDLFSEEFPFTTSMETSKYCKSDIKTGLGWKRTYDKEGRELNLTAKYNIIADSPENEWAKMNGIIEEDENDEDNSLELLENYRIKQRLKENNIGIIAGFKEPSLGGMEGLDSDFTLEAITKVNTDHYESDTLKAEIWKKGNDEDFIYLSTTITPTAHLIWKGKKLNFDARFSPQFYLYRLDDKTHRGNTTMNVNPLGMIDLKWNISNRQSILFTFKEGIKRPDYLNMCWFKRQGSHVNDLYKGNVNLKSSGETEISLFYGFNPGKFHIKAGLKNVYKDRIIESTYNKVGKYRIYTWINGGHSNATSASLDIGWKNSFLSSDFNGTLNNFNGVSRTGNRTISSDYKITGNISCNLKHGWGAGISGKYQSKIKRSYMTMTNYIGCDARISKKFKKIEVYAEGKDLFDNPIVYGTSSEDETEFYYEEINYNRRLVILGIKFNL